MKLCLYARQQCKWPGKGCPREELRPLFSSSPEKAVRKVWACHWAGSRLTVAAYLMQLVEEKKLKVKEGAV